MKSEAEVQEYEAHDRAERIRCGECRGSDPHCDCAGEHTRRVAAFEACLPRAFWTVKETDVVKRHREQFDKVVKRYSERIVTANKRGYGLMFSGDNGVGKTMFACYVLGRAIARGFKTYYTTLPELDESIKQGFDDHVARRRLAWYLTSNFVVIDEMGAEKKHRKGIGFLDTQLERVLKRRYDDGQPTILATNLDPSSFADVYGATIDSLVRSKFALVMLASGDVRRQDQKRMDREMGFR